MGTSTATASRREQARHATGQFGHQGRTAPDGLGDQSDFATARDANFHDTSKAMHGAFKTIADLKAENAAAGHYYFHKDTVRHFQSHNARLYGGCVVVDRNRNGSSAALFGPDGASIGPPAHFADDAEAVAYGKALADDVKERGL